MRALLDASTLIEWKKGNTEVVGIIDKIDDINISSLTHFEFMVGEAKHDEVSNAFFKDYPLLPFTSHDSARAVNIYLALSVKGKIINIMDILIAAQAMERGLTVVSTDSHFKRIKGLDSIIIEKRS
jgi:predicted nucleic acid-binding protein